MENAQRSLSGIAALPDAQALDVWEDRDGEMFRFFRGTRRGRRIAVEIVGFQRADGTIEERTVHLEPDTESGLDGADVQELVDDLTGGPRRNNATRRVQDTPAAPTHRQRYLPERARPFHHRDEMLCASAASPGGRTGSDERRRPRTWACGVGRPRTEKA
jgi:hypothetical protein